MMKYLLAIFAVSFLMGAVLIELEHFFIINVAFRDLSGSSCPITLAIYVFIIAVLLGFSFLRLRPLMNFRGSEPCEAEQSSTLRMLYRLPYELFSILLILGSLAAIGFHAFNGAESGSDAWSLQLGQLAGELSDTFIVGIFIFTLARCLMRAVVTELKPSAASFSGGASIAQPILLTYISTFIAAVLNLFELAMLAADTDQSISPYKFACIAGFYLAIGLLIFGFVTMQFRQELRSLIRHIRALVDERKHLSASMSVISNDEAGELAVVLNQLQSRVNRDYESLEKELKLAYNVQQKLLPPGDMTIGSYRITARCQPYNEVGGDFFDVVSLSSSRFAVMIGDVSGKGMPAALLMSAQLLLFRSEIRRNGSPGEVLARMNRQLCEAMGEEGSITIGVGVIDLSLDTVLYASAGHLSPYIVKTDGTYTAVDCSSLPIGFDSEAVYEEKCLQLGAGDRFVLYTDGLIEADDEGGSMYSFEGLEAEFSTWGPGLDMAKFVDDWLIRMDERSGPGRDDRTVVVLDLAGEYRSSLAQFDVAASAAAHGSVGALFNHAFTTREWSIRSHLGDERQVAHELGRWIEERWPESTVREDVQSAVAEAMINAIEHGNRLQPNSYVTVTAQIGSMIAVCKIYDEGGGYFPRVSRDEDEMMKKLESVDPRGWGLVMIDSLADYWATGRDDRGFYTELYFMRKTKQDHEE
ncbi:SpoIIE family protein phosphatase [Paenibacillus solisilvae]|uniref:SpoIIE family protein phosphatase n=1 Tax=Paenibacillus solisilvae TaxID=2486751 RepID=A0ABW0VX90_9BACL